MKSSTSRRPGQEGFTLLEAIVAITIIALTLLPLVSYIGQAANQMATLPGAFEKMDFVPKSEKVMHATKMLKQGETDTLRFHAPKEPGRYPYICSFPGHYLVMRGVMIVEPAK